MVENFSELVEAMTNGASGRGGALAAGALAAAGVIGRLFRARARKAAPAAVESEAAHGLLVAVARLDGRDGPQQTRQLIESLGRAFCGVDGVRIVAGPPLAGPDGGAGDAEILARTEAEGRRWLMKKDADLLLWGSVAAGGEAVHLRTLGRGREPAEGVTDAPDAAAGSRPPALLEPLAAPIAPGAGVGALAAVQIALALREAARRRGVAPAALLAPALERLAPLAVNPPEDVGMDLRAEIWRTFAEGSAQLGEDLEDEQRLEEAARHFRLALGGTSRPQAPRLWAGMQGRLGDVELRLAECETRRVGEGGGRANSASRLEEAASAYRWALQDWRGEEDQRWAEIQGGLGMALLRLAADDPARLHEALAAFQRALAGLSRAWSPARWARAQCGVGEALHALGLREGDPSRFEAAADAFRASLSACPQEDEAALRAAAQLGLGAALRSQAESGGDPALFAQAADAFRAALSCWVPGREPLRWAAAQDGLGAALRRLAERDGDRAALEEAAAAFRAAAGVRALGGGGFDRAATNWSLGGVLFSLGAHHDDAARMAEAIAAYREALRDWSRERAPLHWAAVQASLGGALCRLGEMEGGGDVSFFAEAAAAYREALGAWDRETAPFDRAVALQGLASALLTLGVHEAEHRSSGPGQGCETLKEAKAALVGALQEFVRVGARDQEAQARQGIGHINNALAHYGCQTSRANAHYLP